MLVATVIKCNKTTILTSVLNEMKILEYKYLKTVFSIVMECNYFVTFHQCLELLKEMLQVPEMNYINCVIVVFCLFVELATTMINTAGAKRQLRC